MAATVNERLADAEIGHALDLLQYSNGVVRRILGLLNRVDADLAAALSTALENMDATQFSVERLEGLLQSVRALNAQAYAAVGRELTEEMRKLTTEEVGYQLQLFETVIPAQVRASVGIAAVDAGQVYAAAMARPFQGRLLREWSQSLESDRMARIRDAVRIGYVEQQPIGDIVRRVRGTRAKGYADGILEIDRRHAEAVVRTAVGHTAGFARDRFMEGNGDLVKAQVWTATLDSRTSPTCFPESTLGLPIGSLHGVSKRPFEGDVIVITTASGKQLRATGNHPVLTARGWRSAKEVEPGKDILCRVVVDVFGVEPNKDVEMEATLGAFADALDQPAISQVLTCRSSEADFHGDGCRGDHEIYVPSITGRDLRQELNTVGCEDVGKSLLVGIELGDALSAFGGEQALLQCFGNSNLANVAPELDAATVQPPVKSAALNAELGHDLNWTHAVGEGRNDFSLIGTLPCLSSPLGEHDTLGLEDAGDGGCGDAEKAPDPRRRHTVGVVADDVVSVVREFFSGHVVNLQTSSELYIAGGFIVHNCRLRDGKQYTPKSPYRPIGHSLPWLGGPGRIHWNCRSTAVPVVKSWKELGGNDLPEFTPTERSSMDGLVPADTTYGQWLKKQSAKRQDEILGPQRGALMRRGGLDIEQFANDKGRWLTLDELRGRNKAAFERAGV